MPAEMKWETKGVKKEDKGKKVNFLKFLRSDKHKSDSQ